MGRTANQTNWAYPSFFDLGRTLAPAPVKTAPSITIVQAPVIAPAPEPKPEPAKPVKISKECVDRIKSYIKFSADRKYFTNKSSRDLNDAYNEINREYRLNEWCDKNDPYENLVVEAFTPVQFALRLSFHMSYNPVRWKESIAFLKDPENLRPNLVRNWPAEVCAASLDDDTEFVRLNCLLDKYFKDHSQNALAFDGSLRKTLVIRYELSGGKYRLSRDYWAFRNATNIFKCVCQRNLADFRHKEYRNEIIQSVAARHDIIIK
ncbi:MAG: hypothetical protein LBH81_03500 [Rickettsiales bacterium]|jgi:hypothetical protein|nr:hypothetical protein [Rickettsiales bacterium]